MTQLAAFEEEEEEEEIPQKGLCVFQVVGCRDFRVLCASLNSRAFVDRRPAGRTPSHFGNSGLCSRTSTRLFSLMLASHASSLAARPRCTRFWGGVPMKNPPLLGLMYSSKAHNLEKIAIEPLTLLVKDQNIKSRANIAALAPLHRRRQ